MAASILRVGRLGCLKCFHLESFCILRRAPAANLSTKSSDPKKPPRKTSIKKAKPKTIIDIAKLLQQRTNVDNRAKKPAVIAAAAIKAATRVTRPPAHIKPNAKADASWPKTVTKVVSPPVNSAASAGVPATPTSVKESPADFKTLVVNAAENISGTVVTNTGLSVSDKVLEEEAVDVLKGPTVSVEKSTVPEFVAEVTVAKPPGTIDRSSAKAAVSPEHDQGGISKVEAPGVSVPIPPSTETDTIEVKADPKTGAKPATPLEIPTYVPIDVKPTQEVVSAKTLAAEIEISSSEVSGEGLSAIDVSGQDIAADSAVASPDVALLDVAPDTVEVNAASGISTTKVCPEETAATLEVTIPHVTPTEVSPSLEINLEPAVHICEDEQVLITPAASGISTTKVFPEETAATLEVTTPHVTPTEVSPTLETDQEPVVNVPEDTTVLITTAAPEVLPFPEKVQNEDFFGSEAEKKIATISASPEVVSVEAEVARGDTPPSSKIGDTTPILDVLAQDPVELGTAPLPKDIPAETASDQDVTQPTEILDVETTAFPEVSAVETLDIPDAEDAATVPESMPKDPTAECVASSAEFTSDGAILVPEAEGEEAVNATQYSSEIVPERPVASSENLIGRAPSQDQAAASEELREEPSAQNEVEEPSEAQLDPVQKLFLDKMREYSTKSKVSGGPVDVGPEYEKALSEELTKLQRLYGGGGDLTAFPEFHFPEPKLEEASTK